MSYVDLPGVGLLISGVERRPVLYDTFCTDYSDRGSKARAWKEVAAEIYEDWHELSVVDKDVREKKMIARWKSIRDNFVRDYKHFSQVEAGLILPKKKKYVFYEQLEFLVPFLKVNDKYSSNMEGDVISEPDEEHQEQAEVKRTRKTPKTKDIKKEREREKSSGAQRIEASPTPVPVVQSTRISEEEKDLDRYGNRGFLMSFLPVMDSLSQADQMQVRLRVSQAFNDVLFSRQSSSPEAKSFYFMTPEESVSMDPLA